MPSSATAFAKSEDDEILAFEIVETPEIEGFRPAFAARFLLKLVRIASAANEDLPGCSQPGHALHPTQPNHCEFDYDYYVALQNRRRHQPSRPSHRMRWDIDA